MYERNLKIPSYVKDALLKNLRSSRFTQFMGWFCSYTQPNCYCVLGVLGKTLEETTPTCEIQTNGKIDNSPVEINIPGCGTYLTDFDGWIRWQEHDVEYDIPPLSQLNDAGLTFAQLADVIEYFY